MALGKTRLWRQRATCWSIPWFHNIFTIASKESVGDIVRRCDKFSIFHVTEFQFAFQCQPYLIQIRNWRRRHNISTDWCHISYLVTGKPVGHLEDCMFKTWFWPLKNWLIWCTEIFKNGIYLKAMGSTLPRCTVLNHTLCSNNYYNQVG